jgi:hypothetical protein
VPQRDDSPLASVAAAIREGHVIGPLSAELLAAEAVEAAAEDRRRREVRAHSNSQVGPIVHQAIDQALGLVPPGASEDEDSFGALFPPGSPLGHVTEDRPPAVYQNASVNLARRRQGRPYSDEELHAALFGDSYYEPGPALGPLSED